MCRHLSGEISVHLNKHYICVFALTLCLAHSHYLQNNIHLDPSYFLLSFPHLIHPRISTIIHFEVLSDGYYTLKQYWESCHERLPYSCRPMYLFSLFQNEWQFKLLTCSSFPIWHEEQKAAEKMKSWNVESFYIEKAYLKINPYSQFIDVIWRSLTFYDLSCWTRMDWQA